MKDKIIKTVAVFLILSGLLGAVFVYQLGRFNYRKLHVVFCDVGQGDGILIRTPNGSDILIDGGPDEKILQCLSSHMPFWDRTIEIMALTHPHADHFTGLINVIERYRVLSFVTENISNKTLGFSHLMQTIGSKNIKTHYVYESDRFILENEVRLEIVGPSKEFIKSTSPQGFIGESREFASVEILLSFREFSAFLTGDSQSSELKEALRFSLKRFGITQGISILQVPHHGSKTSLSGDILDFLKPKLAVISVGKNNKYGHPAASTLRILRDKDIKILRTDRDGDIEIISDGKGFQIRSKISNR